MADASAEALPPAAVTVRYENGQTQAIDVPAEGTMARHMFDEHLRVGRYVIVDEPSPEPAPPAPVKAAARKSTPKSED